MLPWLLVAYFLAVCLIVFITLNVLNLAKWTRRSHSRKEAQAEARPPSGFLLALAVLGTVLFFLMSVTYPIIIFAGTFQLSRSPLQLQFHLDTWIQLAGIFLQLVGYSLFLWSILERGYHPTELVTWGPFRYIRHPSYLGYFLMFIGLFLLLLNLLALATWVAIPGYIGLTSYEESLLTARFGNKYAEYQKRTGRFLPNLRS